MIKTLIFDIGNVLVGYDWDAFLLQANDNDKQVVERIKAAVFDKAVWDEVDRGVWSEAQLMEAFIGKAPDLSEQIHYFWEHAGEALWQFDFAKDWLTELKARGYQILFLSNWSDHMRTQAGIKLDFLPMMDGGVFSYEANLIKPDHAIFELIRDRYNLIPGECVFLDDNADNVQAAKECGFNIVHVTDHESAVVALEELLK